MISEQQIRDMEPGRELDALVAEKVMGKTVLWTFGDEWTDSYPIDEQETIVDHYSNDLLAAWEVAEKLISTDEWMLYRISQTDAYVDAKFECTFVEVHRGVTGYARGVTASEAICKAALIAILRGGSGE